MNTPLLWDILSQPTSPFREKHVQILIKTTLKNNKVPHFLDPIGNLIIGANSKEDYLKKTRAKTREPLRFFVAHMDHPGFHGVKWLSETELEILWHGGSPTAHLENSSVWIGDEQGWTPLVGTLSKVEMIPSGRGIQKAVTCFDRREAQSLYPKAKSLYGGFRFRAPVWEENNRLYTKAADDLVGCFAVVETAISLWNDPKKRALRENFIGILTRAEEVGFIGAIGHLKLGWIEKSKRPTVLISLETSRTLPGAEFGKGPIVRLGDKATTFDPGALKVLTDLAIEVLPGRHQRRIMDGGTCEATAATAFEVPAIGISIPLGNYHNQSFEGGPDAAPTNGPAPEFVDLSDIQGMLELCQALVRKGLPWAEPWKAKKKELLASLKKYQPLLES